jgi:glycosyltransferase involved in cell wall biosynthesis
MKVALFVSGGVDRGGRERVTPALLWLIERLARQHQLLVIATEQTPTTERYTLLGAEVICLSRSKRFLRLGRGWQSFSQLPQVYRILRTWGRPDVIHAFSISHVGLLATLIGRSWRVPTVASIWGGELAALPAIQYGGSLRHRGRLIVRTVLRLADVLTGGSRYVLQMMPGPYQAQWIPLGVDETLFRPSPPHSLNDRLCLLHSASINRVKDPFTLLQALRLVVDELPNIQLDWVGEDTMNGTVQRQASELQLDARVRFYGFQPTSVVAQLCQRATLYVQSSQHESQSVAVLEAASAGVPTVGTAVGLVAELAPGCALAVPCSDAALLAQGLLSLLRDEARRQRLGQAAQTWAHRYNADWTAHQFAQLYQSLC